jgi:6-phosphogluconolactonase (cycloisomerase 2 family)
VNLLRSAVFVQSNFPEGNFVVAYSRDAAGRLSKVGEYPTGGNGSGSFEDASNGLVLGSSEGELAPINNTVVNGTPKGDLLFALNAGSNTVTVFKVEATGLRRVGVTPTGGEKPVSITVNRGLVYVLNSGEFDDRLLPEGVAVPPENCTTGQLPTLTGFKVGKDGVLTPLPGSTRLLSGEKDSGCAQVSFTPNGKTLVVTERIAGKSEPAAPGGFAKGAILTYPVRSDGRLGTVTLNEPVGNGPFGFTFTRDGKIIMTEQNGAFSNPAGGYMASYRINPPETQVDPNFGIPNVALTPVSQPLKTNTADPCWVVLTGDQKLAFVTSAGGDVSSYSVGFDGKLTLLHKSATAADGQDTNADRLQFGATDLSLSADSRYLYQLHSFEGRIYVFLINGNGTLTFVETQDAFDLGTRPRNEGSPFGIVAN